MTMTLRSTLLLSLTLSIVTPEVSGSMQEPADPHWAKIESFALSTVEENGRFPVVTFIPRSFLLFAVSTAEPNSSFDSAYASVETQDGLRVFVRRDVISERTVGEHLGDPSIIFNLPRTVCRQMACNISNDEQVLRISRGEVFWTAPEPFEVIRLEGWREGEKVVGYIREEELRLLNSRGVVTYSYRQHPRLQVSVSL